MVGARPEVDKHPGEGTQHLVVDTHLEVDTLLVEADIAPEVDIVLVGVDNLFKIKFFGY